MPEAQRVQLQVPGLQQAVFMHVHPMGADLISDRLRAERIWEPFETQLFLQTLRPGAVVLDVGANIGYFTLLAATLVGAGGRVFAFEPDAANFALLEQNVADNRLCSRVCLAQLALADRAGAGTLYRHGRNLGDHQIYSGDGARDEVAIELATGAGLLQGQLQRLDLVKIDTQGSEAAVVRGLLPLLQQYAPQLRLLVELTPFSLALAGSSGRELVELLATLKLPFWIVDHVQHALVASDVQALARWSDNVAACRGDRGFMNILVGPEPVPST